MNRKNEDEQLRGDQVASRVGWSRKTDDSAFPERDGCPPVEDRAAAPTSPSRVLGPEHDGLSDIRLQAEGAEQSEHAANRQAQQKASQSAIQKRGRLDVMPVLTKRTLSAIGKIVHSEREEDEWDVVLDAYHGSSSRITRRLYRDLEQANDAGPLAAYLLRAQKTSTRAKAYRGDSRGHSYRAKGKALEGLCHLLDRQNAMRWGWGVDQREPIAPHVLYVDLPGGQVSFHSLWRGQGPDYPDRWDREHASEERIIDFAAAVLVVGSGANVDDVVASRTKRRRTPAELLAERPELRDLQRQYRRRLYEAMGFPLTARDLRRYGDVELAKAVERYPELFRDLEPERFLFDTIGSEYLTKRDLIERGWSRPLIRELLHPPDEQRPMPDGSGAVRNYYDPMRVLAAEKSWRDDNRREGKRGSSR